MKAPVNLTIGEVTMPNQPTHRTQDVVHTSYYCSTCHAILDAPARRTVIYLQHDLWQSATHWDCSACGGHDTVGTLHHAPRKE